MIDYFMLFFSILIPTIFGAGILFLIFYNSQHTILKNRSLSLIISFAIGSGLTTFLMFWWGLAGLPFQLFILFITLLSAAILIVFFAKRVKSFKHFHKKYSAKRFLQSFQSKFNNLKSGLSISSFIQIILLLIIVFQIVFVFSEAALRPAINFDTLANWAFKAKLFFYQPQLVLNTNADLFLGAVCQHYPLHISLFMTWSYLWMGKVNDALVNVIFAFYYLALIAFVYFSLRDFTLQKHDPNKSKTLALGFTAILATIPLLTYHGFIAYADLTLTFYFTLATIFLFKYLKHNLRSNLILAALFSALSVWTKNTGLVLSSIIFIVFLIHLILEFFKTSSLFSQQGDSNKRQILIKDFLTFVFYFLLLTGPWLIFKKLLSIPYTGTTPINQFHPQVFIEVFRQIFFLRSFHFWPVIFILILILKWRRIFPYLSYSHGHIRISRAKDENYAIRMMLLIILGVISAYFSLYFFTVHYKYVLDGTSVGRNFLTLMPISIFLAAIILDSSPKNV